MTLSNGVGRYTFTSVVLLCASGPAWSSAYLLEARTEAQAYQIRAYRGGDPDNPVLLPRRRIVQYLGINGFELITGEDLSFESSVRVYADFGLPRGEAARIDGMPSEQAELMYANARFRTGGVDLQLGRQTYVDIIDYMAFDGLRARYVTRFGLGAEAYGGLWVKAANFLGSSVYQLEGTRESDQRRIANGDSTADRTLEEVEPVYGAKLLLENLKGIFAAAGYRKSLIDGKTDLERATGELRYGQGRGLNLLAGLDYDLSLSRLARFRAQARYDRARFAVMAEGMRLAPVLSANSIWYYFATAPRDELRVRVDYTPVGALRYYLQGVATHYNETLRRITTPILANQVGNLSFASSTNAGGSGGVAYQKDDFRLAGDLSVRRGFGGRQLWLDLTGGYVSQANRYTLDGRISIANISDDLNPQLHGTFVGAQAWASYLLTRAARGSLALEANTNAFVHLDFKVFLLFDLKVTL